MSGLPDDTLRRIDAQRAAEDPGCVGRAYDELMRTLPIGDVLEELGEAEPQLAAAIAKGDATCIGRIVLNVRHSMALRLAELRCGCPAGQTSMSAGMAASVAIYGESIWR